MGDGCSRCDNGRRAREGILHQLSGRLQPCQHRQPCLPECQSSQSQEYQQVLRRAFVRYGLPEQISLDHEDKDGKPLKYPYLDGVVISRHLHQFLRATRDEPLIDNCSHAFDYGKINENSI